MFSLWRRIHNRLIVLLKERGSPQELALAAALGAFVGVSPFYGFHLPLCLALATLFNVNRAFTYLVANISNPFLAPIIVFIELQLGSFLIRAQPFEISLSTLEEIGKSGDFWSHLGHATLFWFVGALTLGVLLSAVVAGMVFGFARGWQRRNR